MGLHVALHHRTTYQYDRPVALGPQTIQLRPAPHCRTPILRYTLEVTPAEHTLRWQFDSLTNHVARLSIPGRTNEFRMEVSLIADLSPINPFDFVLDPGYETFPFSYGPDLARDLAPFHATGAAGPLLSSFLRELSQAPQPTTGFVSALNQSVCNRVRYTSRLEHGVQQPEFTLREGTGSCRDSAWLLVELCRQVGLAARFVSGYLIQLAPAGKPDSADLHAWAEVFLPGAGWVGLDPTSGLFTAEGHIPLACTPTPAQAAPLGGTVEPAEVDFSFEFRVERLPGGDEPDPAQTTDTGSAPALDAMLAQPYTEETWTHIRDLAHQVDRDLDTGDVRLTMGGEPTFVAVDDPESLQWNFAALGPAKRQLGLALVRSLRTATAPGGLLHLGQGKWYPNEALPRWAFQCLSRADGVSIWENPDLFARDEEPGAGTDADALRFLQALARRLLASPENILPAFNPEDATGTIPAGYILPLRRRQPGGTLGWSSQLWFARPERLTLSPGDSAVGYRIPVEAMPWVAPDTLLYPLEDGSVGAATTGTVALPPRPARQPERFNRDPSPDTLPSIPESTEDAPILIRPSLCVELRDGHIHVFLPFVTVLADFLDLVAAIEESSQRLQMPVWVEGYPPPFDARLRSFGLTPDPGVLEINLPPSSDWDDMERLQTVLADEAERLRLTPSKFGFDGTHQATGGGSHITLGGPSVPDSPILRRPDLLRSMLTFWQNHPSLSFLFAGMYVGPTSQYPRVDEARPDALYELDLSFRQLPPESCPPNILDGLFRNLLVDVTGNTHRAEFCIDKLFPPEGTGLRAGLLELRAFEMAPHPRMGLLQALLVRTLVALFWRQPVTAELVRWGTALHDRFMLPFFVEQDFAAVLETLRRAGYAMDDAWFAPHLEFRFPHIGTLTAGGVTLELRQALEPWNVLAEETTSAGTGRSVDSSLERMQVRLTGLPNAERFVVACNGRRVPLHPTGDAGEALAGIRYRARRLSAALHPTIPVHTPLTFDLLDTQTGHAVGRCTYFAGPPDGSIHSTRAKDAAEAQQRRHERFVISPAPAGLVAPPPAETNPVFPMTLDLRWPAPFAVTSQLAPGSA